MRNTAVVRLIRDAATSVSVAVLTATLRTAFPGVPAVTIRPRSGTRAAALPASAESVLELVVQAEALAANLDRDP